MSAPIFSVEGFFEDYSEARNAKYLGRLPVEWPDRVLGTAGTIDRVIKETIVLKRNMKEVKYPVSKHSPIICRCTLYPLCGRIIEPGQKVRIRRTPTEQAHALAPKQGHVIGWSEIPDFVELHLDNVVWTEQSWRLQLIQS